MCVYMSRCLCQTAICLMGAVWKHLIGQSVWIERGLMGRVMCRTALRHTNTHFQLKCDSLCHTKTKGLSWHCRKSPCTHQKKKYIYIFCSAIFNHCGSQEKEISYRMHYVKRTGQSELSIPESSVIYSRKSHTNCIKIEFMSLKNNIKLLTSVIWHVSELNWIVSSK